MNARQRKPKPTGGNGKRLFLLVLAIFIPIVAFATYLAPPELHACKDEDRNYCGCPVDGKNGIDQSNIGRRHVLLIDVTDKLPEGKRDDLIQILRRFSAENSNMFDWIGKGKRSEMLSVFFIGPKDPANTRTEASLCKMPPKLSMFLVAKTKTTNAIAGSSRIADKIVERAYSFDKYGESRIVESIATITSSSTHWTPGSALILASDLRENSVQCGLFENQGVKIQGRPSHACDQFFSDIRKNMHQTDSRSAMSRAFICRFSTKDPVQGLKAYWDEVFFQSIKLNPYYTCSINEALDILNSPHNNSTVSSKT